MKIKWEFILIIALLGLFVFRECSRPVKIDFADQAFKDTIQILRSEKAVIQSRQDDAVKVYSAKAKADSVNLRAQDQRIQALKSKLTNQRPKVIEKIQADSAVLSYVNTLEDVVTEVQIQNDTLKAQAQFQRKLNEQLIFDERAEDRIESEMAVQTSRRISELENSAKKETKWKKFWRGAATVLAGAVLVETVLIVAD